MTLGAETMTDSSNQSWLARSQAAVWHPCTQMQHHAHTGSPAHLPLIPISHGKGAWLYDFDGKRYLDLVAGLAVNNVGHRHPKVVAAIKDQCDHFLHVIPYGEFIQEPQVRFAERLTSILPPGLDSVYFVNSGTEAIEAALKLAKRLSLIHISEPTRPY